MGMDEELKALIREYLDLFKRSVEVQEAVRKSARSWVPTVRLAATLVIVAVFSWIVFGFILPMHPNAVTQP
jgi:hypothetical protein